jgi:hypothetical protein
MRTVAHVVCAGDRDALSANGISLEFWDEEGVLLSIGRKIVPSSRRITSGDPFFAHALAQATPIGLSSPYRSWRAYSNNLFGGPIAGEPDFS